METTKLTLTPEEYYELKDLASRITQSKHEANELVKDTCYLASKHEADKPVNASVISWMLAICVNIQYNNMRRGWNVTTEARTHTMA